MRKMPVYLSMIKLKIISCSVSLGDELASTHDQKCYGVVTFHVLKTPVYHRSPGSLLRCQLPVNSVDFLAFTKGKRETKVIVHSHPYNSFSAVSIFFYATLSIPQEPDLRQASHKSSRSSNFRGWINDDILITLSEEMLHDAVPLCYTCMKYYRYVSTTVTELPKPDVTDSTIQTKTDSKARGDAAVA